MATSAVPGLTLRGFTEGDPAGSHTISAVDTQGGAWLIWAPDYRLSAKHLDRFVRLNGLVGKESDAGVLPFKVPQVKGVATSREGGLVFVANDVGGAPLQPDQLEGANLLASSLGGALAALHELDPEPYAQASSQLATAEQTRSALRKLIGTHEDVIPVLLRQRWLDAVDLDYLWSFTSVPVHGSLDLEDVFVTEGGAVVGMWRFDQGAVGDPAQDLGWLMPYADEDFLGAFEQVYASRRTEKDMHILTRAQLLSELETLRWYARAVEAGDEEWIRAGESALADLAAVLGGDHLVEVAPEVVEISFTAEEEPLLRLKKGTREDAASGPAESGPTGSGPTGSGSAEAGVADSGSVGSESVDSESVDSEQPDSGDSSGPSDFKIVGKDLPLVVDTSAVVAPTEMLATDPEADPAADEETDVETDVETVEDETAANGTADTGTGDDARD